MLLQLSEIPEHGLSVERTLDRLEPHSQACEVRLARPARLMAQARTGPRGIDLSGRVEAAVRLECSRCLDPYESQLEAEFSLVLTPRPAEARPEEQRLDPADAALFYTEEGRADLRALVREQLYLAMPLKPICRQDCAGLCPTCGANRNRIECGCPAEQPDPRLAPLLALKRSRGRTREKSKKQNDGKP